MKINELLLEAKKLKDACWDGYKAIGLKTKNGRKVPNCVKEAIQYHIDNKIPFTECIFRMGSKSYFKFFEYLRENKDQMNLSIDELELINSDLGKFELFEGNHVPLDFPICETEVNESETPPLNKPKRGGSKKFYVYVKTPQGSIKKVSFGDTSGLKAKINDPKARKAFAARHNCDKAKDKTKASYWSCNLPRYAKALGLSGGGNYYW